MDSHFSHAFYAESGIESALLGLIASFLCFVLWTLVIAKIGAMTSSNYLYLNPISTVVISAFVLDEPMTAIAYVGSALILAGVIISNK